MYEKMRARHYRTALGSSDMDGPAAVIAARFEWKMSICFQTCMFSNDSRFFWE